MKLLFLLSTLGLVVVGQAKVFDRQVLSYAPIPEGTYVPPKKSGEVTLFDFIRSRDDLSELAKVVSEAPGFAQAFDTSVNWQYTFFAPSNTAFNNTGQYYNEFAGTPKGQWWVGQMLQHHYIPNSILYAANFTEEKTRIQSGSYLFIGAQLVDGGLVLNNAATVVDKDRHVTNGIVHVIDRILAGDSMIYEGDIKKTTQGFIPGSCSNLNLSYC
ncbi:unnamed protein product [Clonostachys rosea f. rosea IK726]|uniref:FAS1 domain-containing protein n=2 Tax=Bionectria ochroleuca TaxID=29856 RepID=A0A0B7KIW6_BIOOC|nr:unnamed protein product [Clonostachys rosea f. rosea IK726]